MKKVRVFEKGAVPENYIAFRNSKAANSDESAFAGCSAEDGQICVLTRRYITIARILNAGKTGVALDKNIENVDSKINEDAIEYLKAGAATLVIGDSKLGLEILILVQGKDLPCLNYCAGHRDKIICKKRAHPDCWYGKAKVYIKNK